MSTSSSSTSAREYITRAINANIPLLFWGSPGVGKTAAITALAVERGWHLETVIGSTLDPTDLGRPIVEGREVILAPPPGRGGSGQRSIADSKRCYSSTS